MKGVPIPDDVVLAEVVLVVRVAVDNVIVEFMEMLVNVDVEVVIDRHCPFPAHSVPSGQPS